MINEQKRMLDLAGIISEGYTELKDTKSGFVTAMLKGYTTKSNSVAKEFETATMKWLNKNGRKYAYTPGPNASSWELYYNDKTKKCCAVAIISGQKPINYQIDSPFGGVIDMNGPKPTYFIDYDGNVVGADQSNEHKTFTSKGMVRDAYVYVALRTVVANIYPGVEPADKTSKSEESKLKARKTRVLTQVNDIVKLATELKPKAKELEMVNVVKVLDNLIADAKRNT